ncbi:unnamed protein product [Dracunculus medinensis]|uniref:FZ domain-containing protein n=1 Tax=Dracunculus medinensis TaxID=318479 RepID=A0A0N4UPG4_DRAME|nr:unnamed protein product [Dracunculus medinensis]
MKNRQILRQFFIKNFLQSYIFLLLVFSKFCENIRVPHCILKCKDAHMLQMENEWSMDFAFPLLSLLRSTNNETAAYQRAIEICHSNELLVACLDRCNRSTERTILKMGLMPWADICFNLEELRSQFPCWRANIYNLSSACQPESIKLRNSFKNTTTRQNRPNTTPLAMSYIFLYSSNFRIIFLQLIERIFSISQEAINGMLAMKWTILPPTCNMINSSQRNIFDKFLFDSANCTKLFDFPCIFIIYFIFYVFYL